MKLLVLASRSTVVSVDRAAAGGGMNIRIISY